VVDNNINNPFIALKLNVDLNDAVSLIKGIMEKVSKVKLTSTLLNILRLLYIIPDDYAIATKMWEQIEVFVHQIVTTKPSKTMKLNLREFMEEYKKRR